MKTSNVHHQPKHRPPPTVDNSPESVDGASKLISRPDQDILIVIYARYNMPWPGWGGEPAITRTHDSHCWPDTFYFYKHSVPETQQLTSDGVEYCSIFISISEILMNYNSTKNRTHISLDGYNANIMLSNIKSACLVLDMLRLYSIVYLFFLKNEACFGTLILKVVEI